MEEKILQAIEGLNKRFDSIDNRFDTLEGRFDTLEIQVKENTDILKELEHIAQVNKAEHDIMFIDIAKVNGNLKSVQKVLSVVEKITANNWSDILELKEAK